MKYLYSLLFFLLLPLLMTGQNWKTVSDRDTTYFMGGPHYGIEVFGHDSGAYKMILVDSSRKIGVDSVFYFFHGIREPNYVSCLDTLAPSWLGPKMIRKSNGTEYYFNSFDDTITIKTAAALGDTWILAADTLGTVYKGTITASGTELVDNVSDSFKTISIQAYNNATPVYSSYNNLVLKLSKNHGWLLPLDFYRFPNNVTNIDGFGTVVDSGQLVRLDSSWFANNGYLVDLAWKYMPGNEWIYYDESGIGPVTGANKVIQHDSIAELLVISADTVVVTMKSNQYSIAWQYDPASPSPHWENQMITHTWYHADTITTVALIPGNGSPYLPECKARSMQQYEQDGGLFLRWFVDTICGRAVTKFHQVGGYYFSNDTAGCWDEAPGVSGYMYQYSSSLYSFGNFSSHYEDGEFFWIPTIYSNAYYSYLKLNGCTWGEKINVLALDVKDAGPVPKIGLFPNPAKEKVFVQNGSTPSIVSLYDITGRLLQEVNCYATTTELSLAGYTPGIYILSVKIDGASTNYKLQIE